MPDNTRTVPLVNAILEAIQNLEGTDAEKLRAMRIAADLVDHSSALAMDARGNSPVTFKIRVPRTFECRYLGPRVIAEECRAEYQRRRANV